MITDCSQPTIFLYFLFITECLDIREVQNGKLNTVGRGDREKQSGYGFFLEKSEFLVSPEIENSHWLRDHDNVITLQLLIMIGSRHGLQQLPSLTCAMFCNGARESSVQKNFHVFFGSKMNGKRLFYLFSQRMLLQ